MNEYLFKLFPRDISSVVRIHLSESVNNSVLFILRTDGSFSTATEAFSLRPVLMPLSGCQAGCLLFSSLALSLLLLHLRQVSPVNQVGSHREVEEVFLVDEAISIAQRQR